MPLTGVTDLQYIAASLSCEGITREAIFDRIHEISARYSSEIERAASNGAEFHVLPGVPDALEAVSQHPRYRCAVLTGNFETTARYKLNLVDLSDYFDLPGAYGDHSFDRRDLPQLAAQQIKSHLNIDLEPPQFIIIGDTPDDLACAHYFGARSVAVATGHMYGVDELLACEPDAVLPDLSNTEQVMRTLETL